VTDWFFAVPAVRVAEARGASPTWMYRFDFRSPVLDGLLGAAHAAEIPFVFDTLDTAESAALAGAEAPQTLEDTMHAA
jgi:para-nitrobenzyl esterase